MVTDAVHDRSEETEITQEKSQEVSVALSFNGLKALDVPARTLASFPLDFIQGMHSRARDLLVDRGESDPEHWETMWCDGSVHAWVSIQTACPPGASPVRATSPSS